MKNLNNSKRFRITSPDGTTDNAKIFYGDELVESVTKATLVLDAETGVIMGELTILAPICDIELPANQVNEHMKLI